MKFIESELKGAFIIEPELLEDERGYFARTFCRKEFEEQGLNPDLVQCSVSFNKKKGTLRGMHYQTKPHEEAKLVRCTMGAIFDVVIDLRSNSSTFKQYVAEELTADNRKMIYIPEGFAHGFITLQDDSEVLYMMSEYFHSECAAGVLWNDPAFGISWPVKPVIISERDSLYEEFKA